MSSLEERPQMQVSRNRGPDNTGLYVKLGVAGVLAILLLLYIFQNTVKVPFNFLFFDFVWPLWLIILVSLVIGLLIGMLASTLLARRRRKARRRAAGY
jgi:uncharacterized integral membrane protein